MKTIYKYELPVGDDLIGIAMPLGAIIRHIASQADPSIVCLWCEVDTNLASETRYFVIRGTGHDLGANIEAQGKFIGSVIASFSPALVWHVWEIRQ